MQAVASTPAFAPDERRIVHFTGFGHAATHFVELVYPTLAVSLAIETGLPLTEVLSWSFAGYLLFGLGALPAGLAADRFGARRVILFGLMGAGLSAIAASQVAHGWPLAVCLAGLGAAASCYHPAGTGLLSRAVAARGRALGINGIYGNLGIALAPLATASMAAAFGWRGTFALTGGVLVAATVVFSRLRIVEPPRAPRGDRSAASRLGADEVDGDGELASRGGFTEPQTAAAMFRSAAPFIVVCATATLGGFAYRANTVAQPALFFEEISFIGYGLAASLAMGVGVGGQYLGGLVADNRDLRAGYLVFHLCSVPMLVLITFATGAPLLLVSSLYVFFALGMQPIENSLFAALTPERWRSTAYGLKFVLTFGIGSTAVWMVHDVAADDGWPAVYWVLVGVVSMLIMLIGLLFRLTRRAPIHNS